MQFGIVQKERFDAVDGSYSLVTDREIYDSQITATDAETDLLRNYFVTKGESIHVGNVKSDKEAAVKEFKLYPGGDVIRLNLVYPKPEKGELRLYLSKHAGFFPNEGDVWFLFLCKSDNSLWIGSMPEKEWRRENAFGKKDEQESELPDESIDEIDAQIIANQSNEPSLDAGTNIVTPSNTLILRKREKAVARMQASRYKCEFDSKHSLFIAKATGCPYLEVHHIIPICFQKQLHGLKLDSLNNLCCLCPHCHRAIHHAEDKLVKEILNTIARKREIQKNFGLTMDALYRLYSVEDIVR